MNSGIRKDVARRVWIVLCWFEICLCVCISAINIITAITYLKLSRLQNTVDTALKPEVPDLLLIVFGLALFELSTFWYPTLCWRWACQTRTRLQMFSVIGFLADAVWALVIVVLLRPGFCISPDSCCCGEYRIIHYLQVSLEWFQRLISLIQSTGGIDCSSYRNLLRLFSGPYRIDGVFSRDMLRVSSLQSEILLVGHWSRIWRTRSGTKGRFANPIWGDFCANYPITSQTINFSH